MKRPRLPLPSHGPCAYCAGHRTAETLKAHNIACARYGERSYGPFTKAYESPYTKAAVVGFLLGLASVTGCGRTITAPEGVECPRGTVRSAPDTVWTAEGTVGGVMYWCVREGA